LPAFFVARVEKDVWGAGTWRQTLIFNGFAHFDDLEKGIKSAEKRHENDTFSTGFRRLFALLLTSFRR